MKPLQVELFVNQGDLHLAGSFICKNNELSKESFIEQGNKLLKEMEAKLQRLEIFQ